MYSVVKFVCDRLLALILIVVLLPLLLLVALAIAISFRQWPFFSQQRLGKDCKVFRILKFKKFPKTAGKLPDNSKLPAVGRFLKKTSLDELPQLFVILLGKMSFIGPRPLLVQYRNYYTPKECLRHKVLPGLTGLAQINGREALDWDKRFFYDVQYVENLSFGLDLKIFLHTIKQVFSDATAKNDQIFVPMPRLYEQRKYIRLAQKQDNLFTVQMMLENSSLTFYLRDLTFSQNFVRSLVEADYSVSFTGEKFLLLDDKGSRINSLALFIRCGENLVLFLYYLKSERKQMLTKYLELGQKYAEDMGWNIAHLYIYNVLPEDKLLLDYPQQDLYFGADELYGAEIEDINCDYIRLKHGRINLSFEKSDSPVIIDSNAYKVF